MSTFDFLNTINERVMERLHYIPLKPKTILNLEKNKGNLSHLLKKKFPHATTSEFFTTQLQLPFQTHSIDLICSTFTLEWLPDLPIFFNEIKRVLKPQGLFLFSTLGPDTLKELRHAWQQLDHYDHVNLFYDMHDLGDMLVKLKFENPVLDREDITLLYPDLISLFKEIKQAGSVKKSKLVFPFLTEKTVFKKLEKIYPKNKENYFPTTFEVLYGHAFGSISLPEDEEKGMTRISIDKIKRSKTNEA